MRKKLKIDQLAKLRQFTPGMDVEKFLSSEFRQIVRALEQSGIDLSDYPTFDQLSSSIAPKYVKSDSSGAWNSNSTTNVDVTNLYIQIQATNRPINLKLQAKLSGRIGVSSGTSNNIGAYISILRNGTVISENYIAIRAIGASSVSYDAPPGCISFFDESPGNELVTYSIQARAITNTTVYVSNCNLVAYEI